MLFDLDGTLVDSAYQHVSAWHETFTDFRMDIPNWKIHRRIGMSGSFFLPGLLREIGHAANSAQIKRLEKRHAEYFRPKIKTIRVLPGARVLLRHLSEIKLPWTIATSGARAQMEKLVQGLGLPKSLPIVTGDDVKNAKPAPEGMNGYNEYNTLRALGDDVAACSAVYYWPKNQRGRDDGGKFGILHVKCAVADGRLLFLSSANLTEYAFTINMELGVLVTSGKMPGQVQDHFDRLMATGILARVT